MQDPRLFQLAEMLVSDAVCIQPGERVEINGALPAKPLMKALIRTIHAKGAAAYPKLTDDELDRLFFGFIDPEHPEKSEASLAAQAEWETEYWKRMDAHIDIGVDENDSELSAVDSRAMQLFKASQLSLRKLRIDERRWVYLHWPTMADAQKAGMCYDDFFEFFLQAALIDYQEMGRSMKPLVSLMEQTDQVHILGPGTDLSFSIRGIPVVPCDGHLNIPDGEVYTAPVRDSINGVIQYNTAAIRYGKRYSNPRLVFRNGHIESASCDGDSRSFNELLDADEGSRYIGEFALGVNNAITHPIGNTLYDEKIGGSFHLTPGCAYQNAYNGNTSQLHLDIVCIQTEQYGGGEIWFDGNLIRKNGLFVPDSLKGLNP
jgi:aminopeptidase